MGNYEQSLAYARETEEAFRKEGMARWHAHSCHLIGHNLDELGHFEEALSAHEESARIWREAGDLAFEGVACLGLGRALWKQNDLREAKKLYSRAVEAFDDWKDPRGFAYAIEGLGRVFASSGEYVQAARLLGSAERLRDPIGLRRDFGDSRDFEAAMAIVRVNLKSTWEIEWKAGYEVAPSDVRKWALSTVSGD